MKKQIIILILITFLTACAPAATSTPVPTQMQQPSQMPMVTDPPTATVEASPTAEIQPTETKKPKGQNQPIAPTSTRPEFVATEILGRPTDTSVTVNVIPAFDMDVVITYGILNGTAQTITVNGKANTPTEITLTNLTPDTSHFYTVNGGTQHTFHTARAQGSTFTFDIQGDSHPERTKNQFDPNLYSKTLLSAAADQPDFYIATGDDFSVDTLKDVNPQTVAQLYINQRQWLGLVDAPVFLVNGNHEQAALANYDGTPNNVAVWAANARNANYPLPAPDNFYTGNPEPVEHIGLLHDYYAWTWGDALFIVIDPYWHSQVTVDNLFGDGKPQQGGEKGKRDLWEVSLGETQYQWFKQTLETSNAKYKFVFTHHVLGTGRGGIELATSFEWGDAENLADHRTWDKTIHQLMVDNNVTIFFQGHDHIFARQELDGVVYQSLPEPGNPFYSWENEQAYKSGDLFPNSGHVRVTVSPNGVTVDYVRSYLEKPDEVAFTYSIP